MSKEFLIEGPGADIQARIENLERQGWEDVQRIIELERTVEALNRDVQALEQENQYLRGHRDARQP